MTVRLADIRGSLEHGYGLAGGLGALLSEIVQRLEQLAAGGTPEAIDLRSLPLNPAERERLAGLLGEGEVDVTLTLDGDTRVRETGLAGVWWIEHREARGQVIAELLEIARIPEILNADAGDVARSAGLLRARIAAAARGATTEDAP
jgi:hydrogenase-1 operon protein HyaF